mgnify:CR=1 FL=1
MMIAINQIKAARALLNMKQSELAKRAGVSIATLNNIERGAQTDPKLSTMRYIQQALEKEGILFINSPFDGIGVQLKPRHAVQSQPIILIVDDSKSDRKLYKSWLQAAGKQYRIIEADNARGGFDAFIEHQPQCIILDFMMYGADGFQLLAALRRDHDKLPPIIFISAMHNDVLAQTAGAQGVFCSLDKNKLTSAKLNTTVMQALQQ